MTCKCGHGDDEHAAGHERGRCLAVQWEDPLPGGGTSKQYCECQKFVARGFDFAEADRAIRETWAVEKGRNKRNMSLGWFAARMKAADLWQKYGYADEADYRDRVGVSGGVWGRYVRIAGQFLRLDLERFVLLSAENAEALGRLPEELRYEHQWLENAVKMPADAFRGRVAEQLGQDPAEVRVGLRFRVFAGQKTVIEQTLKEFARENGIADEGTALEWMAIEYSGRTVFLKFLKDETERLRGALHDDAQLKAAVAAHVQAMAAMLQRLRGEKRR